MKMVQKTTPGERINHFMMATSFIVLAMTGLGFTYGAANWMNDIFGGNAWASTFHKAAGLLFALSVIITLGSNLAEALRFDESDSAWLKHLGGYFGDKAHLPPQGKMNMGQKFFYLAIVVGAGALITLSGLIVWGGQGGMAAGHLLHNLAFFAMIVTVPGHIYLATAANPGTFRIMTIGTVPLWWAKKKYGKWIKEEGLE
jgi:formate dehydrogenase subunit gamma